MSDRVRPFCSGSQMGDWDLNNCESCAKSINALDRDATWESMKARGLEPCEIEHAISRAYIGDGTVSAEIAERMGACDEYTWPCPEHDPPFVNVERKES